MDSDFIISIPVPTFIFPCPRKNSCVGREKFLRGQGEKYTQAEKGNYKSIWGNGRVSRKGDVLTFMVEKYR